MPELSPSPFFVLEKIEQKLNRTIRPGDLGVIMARAGVGKTTFMVRMGLAELWAGRGVVHIALGQNLSDVHTRYEAIFEHSFGGKKLPSEIRSRLVIQAYSDRILSANRLQKAHADFSQHLRVKPSLVLVDAFDWNVESFGSQLLRELRRIGAQAGASVCVSARIHREVSGSHPVQLPQPVRRYRKEVAWAVFLEPVEYWFSVRLLYAFGNEYPDGEWVLDTIPTESSVEPKKVTLLSGGAKGAESFFGECAERFGLEEQNFTFEGRAAARQKGLVFLSAEQLRQGDVSIAYVKSRMHRSYQKTDDFRRVLQSIWHQVNPAGEVFVVGVILPDKTVKGGTGWAVELAKHLGKTLYIFDQDKVAWYEWKHGNWDSIEPPCIRHSFFTGTGTRSLAEVGRSAIFELFSRSFELP